MNDAIQIREAMSISRVSMHNRYRHKVCHAQALIRKTKGESNEQRIWVSMETDQATTSYQASLLLSVWQAGNRRGPHHTQGTGWDRR